MASADESWSRVCKLVDDLEAAMLAFRHVADVTSLRNSLLEVVFRSWRLRCALDDMSNGAAIALAKGDVDIAAMLHEQPRSGDAAS